ncbi:MAG: putative RNA methylase [Hyperionvirus sp.]|uniref:Putative RNA methylase n=1 Tax=Hyperionvirus sp. TaxID=2487770 RepID=A0A3G5AAG7_9VIRU|nr:MAG: putative RNA methylase [Hyperionvirus sp.]
MRDYGYYHQPQQQQQQHKIYIDRLFPDVREFGLQHKLKINLESIMYITIPYDADKITKIICNHMGKGGLEAKDAVITDGTAGVGGNTISFVRNFLKVNAIEIDQERFNYLFNNVNLYGDVNVTFFRGDAVALIPKLKQDIIFIDPPWGGKCYKEKDNIKKLCLGELDIEELCWKFLDGESMVEVPKLIVLKLPKNYDVQMIYRRLGDRKIYYYGLNKMIIIVVENYGVGVSSGVSSS